ncbi:MAG: SCP2 sterol-binding domain-containing protein [bacterium]
MAMGDEKEREEARGSGIEGGEGAPGGEGGADAARPGALSRAASAAGAAASRVKEAIQSVIPTTVSAERPTITPDEMYKIARVFAEKIFGLEEVVPKLLESKVIVRFKYYDENWGDVEPEITIDCTGDRIVLHTGPCELEPVVTMRMHGDTAHKFWKQKVNLMAAITKGEISAKGPIPKVMKLLPIIKPSYPLYLETLKDLGFSELLNYPPEEPRPGQVNAEQ